MSTRTGLGALEVATLAAVQQAGGSPTASHRKTTDVLDILEREQPLGGRYAYPLLQDLAASWRLHLPLLEGLGNWGSQHGDAAAEPRYTEVRLTRVGELALAAEQGRIGPIPLGLIEGSLYRDGPAPPFAPEAVLTALTSKGRDSGPPVLPTGGQVDGDIEALLAGRSARLSLSCTIITEPGRLVITQVPLGVRIDDVTQYLADRAAVQEHADRPAHYLSDEANAAAPARPRALRLIRDVRDESSRVGLRVVCVLAIETDIARAINWVRSTWPVTVEIDCRLPEPRSQQLLTWNPGDGTGLAALAALC